MWHKLAAWLKSYYRRRYQTPVKQHMTPSTPLASAVKDIACAQKTTFATTQAVWRFLNHDLIAFSQLNQLLITLAQQGIASRPHCCALVVHDWSRLQFFSHRGKRHRLQMTHATDVGYERQSRLRVDAASGLPVVPLAQTLTDNLTRHSTFSDDTGEKQTHLDALTADIFRIEALDVGKTRVHLIDREGDSIAHMRELDSRSLRWLIRGKEGHRVEYQGRSRKLGEVADELAFTKVKQVDYKGKKAHLSLSETAVNITRAAKPKRIDNETGRRVKVVPGNALTVKLVVARRDDDAGQMLCRWT
ncbi:hypothetical protein [Xenorhabdus thailandensis]|uniref:hypothetical protein n=1 Tax=Xenorhabdus thailandensis TaxID=3136255 RepID=UPI0030F39319